jgi:hypothetical protein
MRRVQSELANNAPDIDMVIELGVSLPMCRAVARSSDLSWCDRGRHFARLRKTPQDSSHRRTTSPV